jgi:hypothetical protein
MMAKTIIFLVLILCFFQACELEKDNPVWSGSGKPIDYVGLEIYSMDGNRLNPQYFNGYIFLEEDPFNSGTPDSNLVTFDKNSLGSLRIDFRANTYPFDLDSLQIKNWVEKKEKISWQWKFWRLSELKGFDPYTREEGWEWISALFSVDDILDWSGFILQLKEDVKKGELGLSFEIYKRLPEDIVNSNETTLSGEDKSAIVDTLNILLEQQDFYQEEDFPDINLPEEAQELLERGLNNLSNSDIQRFNWFLIAAAYPDKIVQTPFFSINMEDQQKVEVKFPCPDKQPFNAWRVEAFMFDANGDSLGLPYILEIGRGKLIKGLPIRVTCGSS